MSELTAEKIRLVALAVEALRHAGRYEFNAPVSHREMEKISHEIGCPVSAREIARYEEGLLAKAKLAALALQPKSNPPTHAPQ